jgi:hypothetical protein
MTENYEKDFVPKNPALALKKLGFDEPCLMAYLGKEKEPYLECDDVRHLQAKDVLNPLKAPTFSQAFRYFREKYGLYHSIGLDNSLEDDVNCDYQIINHNQSISELETDFKSYEEAELACLIKLIEICKSKNKEL